MKGKERQEKKQEGMRRGTKKSILLVLFDVHDHLFDLTVCEARETGDEGLGLLDVAGAERAHDGDLARAQARGLERGADRLGGLGRAEARERLAVLRGLALQRGLLVHRARERLLLERLGPLLEQQPRLRRRQADVREVHVLNRRRRRRRQLR